MVDWVFYNARLDDKVSAIADVRVWLFFTDWLITDGCIGVANWVDVAEFGVFSGAAGGGVACEVVASDAVNVFGDRSSVVILYKEDQN